MQCPLLTWLSALAVSVRSASVGGDDICAVAELLGHHGQSHRNCAHPCCREVALRGPTLSCLAAAAAAAAVTRFQVGDLVEGKERGGETYAR
ncbi:unnamed protein product [Closterium sp. NIES-65]|nr:unnamed protein product [Closterium sp. NIES-65]